MTHDFNQLALEYHALPKPGKISVTPTKPLSNQFDLSLAYSPGVAAACMEIYRDESLAAQYTSRANLVGVITNGSAVLGLGNIGPAAAKPVMEGKGCLFKKFAGIDVFDIELNEQDPDKLIDIIAALEPTLGGVNLEDIKAPECFYIEQKLRERMKIPVFHDDQHGTAIIASAALINGLKLVDKPLEEIKLVCSGAGAAAIACLNLFVTLGLSRDNIYVCDSRGLIWQGRDENMEANKALYAQNTDMRTMAEALVGADVFLGCSTKDLLTGDMIKPMARDPILLALANPDPEILPEVAKAARPDCIIATGRSDYPNQVNNVLCFPYIFRGALDAGATSITEEMKMAAVHAIAELAQIEQSDEMTQAYQGHDISFGPEFIIPKPFDPRLISKIAPAVAQAAADSGVATRPIQDMKVYERSLSDQVYHSGHIMRPVFELARANPKRVVLANAEEEVVLRAAQAILDERIAELILIGRPSVIKMRIEKQNLRRIQPGVNVEIVDPDNDDRFYEAWQTYHRLRARDGITPQIAKAVVRKHNTLIGALLIERGDADAMLCGIGSQFDNQLEYIDEVIGMAPGAGTYAALNVLLLPEQTLFICDTHVNEDPTAQQIADMTLLAAEEVKRFGITPKIALLSHSNFGSRRTASAQKMAYARDILAHVAPDLELDGEMQADAALSEEIRKNALPETTLSGEANLFITPNLDTGNITYNFLKMTGSHGVAVGPILLGAAKPVHILTNSSTARRIINMTAIAVVQAQMLEQEANSAED
ncbi:NADP-dependent malic enzyme [Orrella sp. 11846]|uniref:NADP-dependent malic enzyme n=1 Tax=Orrella sp. 11846 TaxID=3409913 RepID=UPI003B5A5DED